MIGQVLTAGVDGTLSAVRMSMTCTSGAVYLEVRDAFEGRPGTQVLAQRFFPEAALAFPTADWRTIAFPSVLVRRGEQFAITVLAADFGSCTIRSGAAGQTYGGGDAFSTPPWDQINWSNENRDLAFETMMAPVALTQYGIATTDGAIAAGEWEPAAQMHFDVNLPDATTTPGTLMVMNDGIDVHVSIVYERDEPDARNFANINADNNNDGRSYQANEDLWSVNGDGVSGSFFSDSVGIAGDCPPPHACHWLPDEAVGGTPQGQGRVGLVGNVFAIEVSHPFKSGDEHDIALLPGARFGVNINMSIQSLQQFDAASGFTSIPNHFEKAVPIAIVNPPQSIGAIEFADGFVTDAFAINNDGSVTGNVTVSGRTHPFLLANGILRDIHQLGTDSSGAAISDNGIVVGSYFETERTRGYVWSAGRATDVGDFGLALETAANGVNSAGHVVGRSSALPLFLSHAFRRTPQGMEDIHQLGSSSEAFDINDTGQIVGAYEGASTRAFLLTYGGAMIDLGTLGGASSEARAINDSGTVAGSADRSDGFRHAFKYDRGVMTDLGALPGTESHAWGINSHGIIVGDSGGKAVMFKDGRVIDLNTLLPPGSGWVLSIARGINDAGQIAGYGSFNGTSRAFLLNTRP
jgi:probable HAF family extracellular repeat protein